MGTKISSAIPQPFSHYSGAHLSPEMLMKLAIDAARQGVRGANPLVGAVISDASGQVLSVGWHRGAGTPHAEADALARAQAAGIDIRGTHMSISLEPCNHTGRTEPCAQAIGDAEISSVSFAAPDTTANAAGGAEYLRSHGVSAEPGMLQEPAQDLNHRWFAATAQQRPFVSAKIASSLDGLVAAADGTSQWITSPHARKAGHDMRMRADAVMVGTGTVLADNPRLTARDTHGKLYAQQPLPVIMGQRDIPENFYLAQNPATLHLRTHNPREVLTELYSRGVRHLMIEGGPSIISAFLAADLVDELLWLQAPTLLGAGTSAIGNLGITTLAEAQQWELDDLGAMPAISRAGRDVQLHLAPQPQR